MSKITQRYRGPSRRPGESLAAYVRRRRREADALGRATVPVRLSLDELERLARAGGDAWPATFVRRACRDIRRRQRGAVPTFVDITVGTAEELLRLAEGRPALPGLLQEKQA